MPDKSSPLRVIESDIRHNTKVKLYPDGSTMTTYCSCPIFLEKGFERAPDPKDFSGDYCIVSSISLEGFSLEPQKATKAPARDRTDELIRVHKTRIKDIVLCNKFTHFLTLTINPECFDSFDPKVVSKKLHVWLNHQVRRKGLKYVLIPEYHKSGRIHAHALVNDVFRLVDSGKRTSSGKIIYNCPDWRYGFTTAIPLDNNVVRVANYVTKYITKGSDKIFGKYFWSSKNIVHGPEVVLADTDFESVPLKEYKPINWLDTMIFKYDNSFSVLNECPDLDEATALATEMEDNL